MTDPTQPDPPTPLPLVWPTPEQIDRFDAALFPYLVAQRNRVLRSCGRFVHYTTGEGADGILRNRSVWLRSTTCMNDYSEVMHGYNCLRGAWSGDSGKVFQEALDKCHPGIAAEVVTALDKQTGSILHGSFVACFSEHDPKEDQYGRLSMWRAYCNPTGVALVLNSTPFFGKSDALKAYSSPVAYLSDGEFNDMIFKVAANVDRERAFLNALDRRWVLNGLLNMLKFAILCTKHPAFAEEREWRVVYTPGLVTSDHMVRNVRTIRGVPQTVHELPLRDLPQEGLVGLEIPQLLHRIIIGPTQYGSATGSALWFLLKDAGIADPSERIIHSGVPLRT